MGRAVTAVAAFADALPFAAAVAAAIYVGGSSNLGTSQATVIAAIAGVALLAILGAVSYAKYVGTEKPFWLLRTSVNALAFSWF